MAYLSLVAGHKVLLLARGMKPGLSAVVKALWLRDVALLRRQFTNAHNFTLVAGIEF